MGQKYLFISDWYHDRITKFIIGSDGKPTYDSYMEINNATMSCGGYFNFTGSGKYLYFMLTDGSNARLHKIDAKTMQVSTYRDWSFGNWVDYTRVLGNYVYFFIGATQMLYRVSKDDLSGNESLDLSSYTNQDEFDIIMDDNDSSVLWIACGHTGGSSTYDPVLIKVNVSPFSYSNSYRYSTGSGLGYGLGAGIAQDTNYIYLLCHMCEVLKIDKTDLSLDDYYTDGTDDPVYPRKNSFVENGYLYGFYNKTYSGIQIRKFQVSDMTLNDTFTTDYNYISDAFWTWRDGFIYIAQYNEGGWNLVQTVTYGPSFSAIDEDEMVSNTQSGAVGLILSEISLGNLDIDVDNIIDFHASQANNVAVPEWLNQNPELDENVWSKTKERLEYIMRMTDVQYNDLKVLQNSHNIVDFGDEIYGFSGSVWIERVEAEYDDEWDYPWKVTLVLISWA